MSQALGLFTGRGGCSHEDATHEAVEIYREWIAAMADPHPPKEGGLAQKVKNVEIWN